MTFPDDFDFITLSKRPRSTMTAGASGPRRLRCWSPTSLTTAPSCSTTGPRLAQCLTMVGGAAPNGLSPMASEPGGFNRNSGWSCAVREGITE